MVQGSGSRKQRMDLEDVDRLDKGLVKRDVFRITTRFLICFLRGRLFFELVLYSCVHQIINPYRGFIHSELCFWSELISLYIKVINSGLQCSLFTLNGLYCFMVIIYKYLHRHLEILSKNNVKENANNVILRTLK